MTNSALGWIAAGVVAVIGGGVAIYEYCQAEDEKKKRSDAESKHCKEKAKWQRKHAGLLNTLDEETKKRTKLQNMVDELLKGYEQQHENCTSEEIDSLKAIFDIFVDDGASIFAFDKNKKFVLSDQQINMALEVCSAVKKSSLADNQLSSRITYLEQRLRTRLTDIETQKKTWQLIEDNCKNQVSIQAIPKFQNKGGFICSIGENNLAFMPNSHFTDQCAIDKPVDVLIISADSDSRRVIISAKELKAKVDFEAFAQNNFPGTKISGKIVCILGEESHAALVSISDNNICGYLPKSGVIGHPTCLDENIFTVGQTIDVYVRKIDDKKQHVLLSMYKAPQRKKTVAKVK